MRIIEIDLEWNKFLKELYERKSKKIEEVGKILDSLFASLVLSFFNYLVTSKPNLAYKILNMYERNLQLKSH